MKTRHSHNLIAKTAKEMAEVIYEELMVDNSRYKEWKAMCPDLKPKLAQKKFVALMWPRLLEQARTTLAKMLAGNYPEALKEQIHNALVLDNDLRLVQESPGQPLH